MIRRISTVYNVDSIIRPLTLSIVHNLHFLALEMGFIPNKENRIKEAEISDNVIESIPNLLKREKILGKF